MSRPVIKQAAQSNDATYIDTFDSSIGDDACKAPGTAWVNGIIPTSSAPAAPQSGRRANVANQALADTSPIARI